MADDRPLTDEDIERHEVVMPRDEGHNVLTAYRPQPTTVHINDRTGYACDPKYIEIVRAFWDMRWRGSSSRVLDLPNDRQLLKWKKDNILKGPEHSRIKQILSWWVTDPDTHGVRTIDRDGTNPRSVCQIQCMFFSNC
jgi:hypothetical protein